MRLNRIGHRARDHVTLGIARHRSDVGIEADRDPRNIAVERRVGSREGKVYLDYLQNHRGDTVVPPYVVRPVPGASVSTPLEWDELEGDLHPSNFTLRTAPARFERVGDLFGAARTDGQDLLPALERLTAAGG